MSNQAALHAEIEPISPAQTLERWLEPVLAYVLTGFVATLLVRGTINAGPLWRDETNSINMAQMPTLGEFWHNMPFESFPALWLLILRAWNFVGFAQTDLGVRILGFLVGAFFLCSLWLCFRWVRGRAPILSLALLGGLPVFINVLGANRAYGLASCLLVLTFGSIWLVVVLPSKSRVVLAGIVRV